MSRQSIQPKILHQAVHGYRHGHQLLGASTDFDDETADILGHNSDSAPRSRSSNGSYLTGYPLPNGDYVVARTWPDEAADRPNTVVTRSVVVPRASSGAVTPHSLLEAFERPTAAELTNRLLKPVPAHLLGGHPISVSPSEGVSAASYYWSASRLHCESEIGRQRIALSIWGQLWSGARESLFFCTSPDTTRFADQPRPLLFEGGSPEGPSWTNEALQVVADDLAQPGPFREFMHFVGSGESNAGLAVLFAEAFILLELRTPRAIQLTQLLVEYRGLEPRRLRRLKRRLLSFHGGAPRWGVDPFDLLDALSHGDLGSAMYASDASLDRWLATCWRTDPRTTADMLERTEPGDETTPPGPPTAAEGLGTAFASQASVLISPQTLSLAGRVSPKTALAAVWNRNDAALWTAWAELDLDVPAPTAETPRDGYGWEPAALATRERPEKLAKLLERYPESVHALVAMLERHPRAEDVVRLPKAAQSIVRRRLEVDDAELVGLAHAVEPSNVPDRLQSAAWEAVLNESTDLILHAVAYLIARQTGSHAPVVGAIALGHLYEQLEGSGGQEAWSRLSPQIRGDHATWDRCGRLVEDYRETFRRLDQRERETALSALERTNPEATRALASRLMPNKAKHFSLWDPTTWLS